MAKRLSKETGEKVEFNDVRKKVREAIIEKYGSVMKFLNSDKGKEFGGAKIKVYLYDTGPVSMDVIGALSKFFGIGLLSRKLVVTRSFSYELKQLSK